VIHTHYSHLYIETYFVGMCSQHLIFIINVGSNQGLLGCDTDRGSKVLQNIGILPQHYNPEDHGLNLHYHENLKFHKSRFHISDFCLAVFKESGYTVTL